MAAALKLFPFDHPHSVGKGWSESSADSTQPEVLDSNPNDRLVLFPVALSAPDPIAPPAMTPLPGSSLPKSPAQRSALMPSQSTPLPRPMAPSRSRVSPASRDEKSTRRRSRVTSLRPEQDPKVRSLPTAPPHPLWLRSLLLAQQGSLVVVWLLVAAVLSVYGWTVYTQQSWSRDYRSLQHLQRQERELTATSAVLENDMANTAENPGMGLMLPSPDHTLFLQPAPPRATANVPSPTELEPPARQLPLEDAPPLGY